MPWTPYLHVIREVQEHADWCCTASVAMVCQTLGEPRTQQELFALGVVRSLDSVPERIGQIAIARHFHPLSSYVIRSELERGSPVVVVIRSVRGTEHAVVLKRGFYEDGAPGLSRIVVVDPHPTQGIATWSWAAYEAAHLAAHGGFVGHLAMPQFPAWSSDSATDWSAGWRPACYLTFARVAGR